MTLSQLKSFTWFWLKRVAAGMTRPVRCYQRVDHQIQRHLHLLLDRTSSPSAPGALQLGGVAKKGDFFPVYHTCVLDEGTHCSLGGELPSFVNSHKVLSKQFVARLEIEILAGQHLPYIPYRPCFTCCSRSGSTFLHVYQSRNSHC